MFASYGYPRHSFGAGACGGLGLFSNASRYDEEAYAYDQYRRRQAELAHLERARQIRAAREEAYLREVARRQQERELAVRQERARRQDPLVEVVFSDGSHRLAPLSWVRKQRRPRDAARETPAAPHGPRDVATEPRPREALTLDEAATTVQRFLRRHLRLRQVSHVGDTFYALRESFAASPAARDPSTLVFAAEGETAELAFNTPANKDLQLYEEELVRLLTKLDGIESHGDDEIKRARKGLAVEIEQALSGLDQLKAFGWDAQRRPEPAQAEPAHAEPAQAGVAQPELAQPEVAQPEVAQPEVARIEVAQPRLDDPAVEQAHPEPADLVDTDMEDGEEDEAPVASVETKQTESVASSETLPAEPVAHRSGPLPVPNPSTPEQEDGRSDVGDAGPGEGAWEWVDGLERDQAA